MKLILTMLVAITLNNAALYGHYKYADSVYQNCYYNSIDFREENDLEICMKKDTTFRVFGTLLFTEGSYLEEVL